MLLVVEGILLEQLHGLQSQRKAAGFVRADAVAIGPFLNNCSTSRRDLTRLFRPFKVVQRAHQPQNL